jgi:hypothetical protein
MGTGRSAGTTERARSVTRSEAARPREQGVDPAFHRAMLKIALELRKPSARGYDAIIEEVIRGMELDAAAFRRFLGENGARNMSLLLTAARGRGL